jgi:hypothetical protein
MAENMLVVVHKVYQTGRKLSKEVKENMKIIFDEYLPV